MPRAGWRGGRGGERVSHLELKIRENREEPYIEFHVDGQDLGAVLKAVFGEAGFDDVLP